MRTLLLTAVAMMAFASNSILCRLALWGGGIDAASFTALRITSGAVTLFAIARLTGRTRTAKSRGSWTSAAMLFLYAIGFSLAYLSLTVATGALILFGAVQLTMIGAGLARGERPRPAQWLGIGVAMAGLVYLVAPGLEAPSPVGAALMTLAGMGWGFYSIRGRGGTDPVVVTTDNFVRAVPMVVVVAAVMVARAHLDTRGVILALASGSLASGVGYVIWYAALAGLSATRAAAVQLTVPVIAAVAGVIFVGESISARLVIASVLILGGVGVTLAARERLSPRPSAARP